MIPLSQVKIKIFLRDDIWRRITGPGFREASHITRTLTLTWDNQSLMNLLVRRIASNVEICDYYDQVQETLLADAALQEKFFYQVFPDQVDIGSSKPKTFDWMLSRTADGSKRTAPRELIHLLLETRDEQLNRFQLGNSDPEDGKLFDRISLRAALPAVSRARFQQTLCAEYPAFKSLLDRLETEKTQQTVETLARLWKCGLEKAAQNADRLVEAGFFERRGSKENPNYWVPFLYRDALNMVQGAAE